MAIEKLSATFVAKTATKPGRYGDGAGLWLQVSRWKTKSWIFQYTAPGGRIRQLGLGALHTTSLKRARELAREAREQVRDGIDPIELRRQKRLKAPNSITFRECAERYIAAHEGEWGNDRHREQWRITLSTYAFPFIGEMPVAAIDTPHILQVLEPIWSTKPSTASRLRGRIEHVLDWAKVRRERSGENPARWKGHLAKLLAAPNKLKTVRHHPALPYDEVAAFMADLRARDGISARALEITILTALRTGEVINAQWNEIDLAGKMWTIPAARMKMNKEHRIPLSDRVTDILTSLPREGSYVFIGGRSGAPLSSTAMLELLRGMRPGLTVHGFRSTFRDWAAELTNYPNHVVELALAHAIGDKVEAAYRRGDLFDKRRQLMAAWARYCQQKPIAKSSDNGNVVPIRSDAS